MGHIDCKTDRAKHRLASLTDEEESSSNRYVVLEKDSTYIMDGACKQRKKFERKWKCTVDISGTHNEGRRL